MRKITGCFVVVLAFACVGLLIGYGVGHHRRLGGSTPWESDPLPDGQRPVTLRAGPFTDVYVESEQGRLFVQTCTLTPEEWRTASEWVSDGSNMPLCGQHSDLSDMRIQAPPGPVKAQLDCQIHLEYTAVSCRYVILENEELWRWHFVGPGLQGALEGIVSTAAFCIAGGVLGLLLYWTVPKLRERQV